VFDTLIVSKPQKRGFKNRLGGQTFSIVMHALLIYLAIEATLGAGLKNQEQAADTNMVYLKQEEQKPQEPAPPPPPPKGFQTLMAPVNIPTSIPPINLNQTFDPRDFSGVGVELGTAKGVETGPVDLTQVFVEAVVDEPPERISFPPPEYPRMLQEAHIEGQVVLEAVIDTTGHAEPNSIKVISSTNRAFEAPAKDALRRALFRPGRVRGQPVRVLVHLPIRFVIPK
jgi:periplasmic protein TonB